LVKRKQPTGCDLAVDDLVHAHGGPAVVDAADRRKPVGKRGEPISVPNENFSSLRLERAIGEVSSCPAMRLSPGTVQLMLSARSSSRAEVGPPA